MRRRQQQKCRTRRGTAASAWSSQAGSRRRRVDGLPVVEVVGDRVRRRRGPRRVGRRPPARGRPRSTIDSCAISPSRSPYSARPPRKPSRPRHQPLPSATVSTLAVAASAAGRSRRASGSAAATRTPHQPGERTSAETGVPSTNASWTPRLETCRTAEVTAPWPASRETSRRNTGATRSTAGVTIRASHSTMRATLGAAGRSRNRPRRDGRYAVSATTRVPPAPG